MSWSLAIHDQNATLQRTFERGDVPNAVMGLPTVIFDADGRVERLNVNVRNDLALIEPRAILKYTSDTVNAPSASAWAVVVTSPPLDSPGAGRADRDSDALNNVTAVGLEQLLRDRVVGPRLYDRIALANMGSADIATIAHDLASLYAHPAVIVDPSNFPATGTNLSLFYAPETTLAASLDELRGKVTGGARWWINEARELCFEATS